MRRLAWVPVLVAACAFPGTRSGPARFYALTAAESSDGQAVGSWDVSLGLGPVAIPGYLDRPQLVTRVGPNELRLAETARWGEPLREGVVRTLRQDIQVASGARRVALYPWMSGAPVDLAVAVDVLRFERAPDGRVELVARWTVREMVHGRVLAVRESRVDEPVQGTGTAAEVAALSRTLGTLGREIAAAVREARPSPSE